MWNGSPRLANFTQAAFRASTIAACMTATAAPATAQTNLRFAVVGHVASRCWISSPPSTVADRGEIAAVRCSSPSTQVLLGPDEPGDGAIRPCASTVESSAIVRCDRTAAASSVRVTITPRS